MKKMVNRLAATYGYGDYRVDIVWDEDDDDLLGAWLYHRDGGVKSFMFGAHENFTAFLKLVEEIIENYIRFYEREFGRY